MLGAGTNWVDLPNGTTPSSALRFTIVFNADRTVFQPRTVQKRLGQIMTTKAEEAAIDRSEAVQGQGVRVRAGQIGQFVNSLWFKLQDPAPR